jgi:DNA-binding response OmpR family regulator
MKVLVVEDEDLIASFLLKGLRASGYAVERASRGAEALELAGDADLLILDLGLPDMDGLEVLRTLRERKIVSPVIVLTARGDVDDRVRGLDLGADDYLPKPFAFAEVVARIRALARRNQRALPPTLVKGDIRLDTAHRTASRARRRLDLSPKELTVLELLLAADGATVSTQELLRRGWDEYTGSFSNVVKVTISRLRRKLGDPPVIETVSHAGYRI